MLLDSSESVYTKQENDGILYDRRFEIIAFRFVSLKFDCISGLDAPPEINCERINK